MTRELEKQRKGLRPVRIFYAYVFAVTWSLGLAGLLLPRAYRALSPFSHTSPFFWMAGYAISAIGIAMTAFYDGKPGLRRLLDRLLPWRAAPYWYLIVIGGYVAITYAAFYEARWFGVDAAPPPGPGWWVAGLLLTLAFDVGPLGEEFGWRGFALPRLLEWRSPLAASLILGAIHAVWHLPLFFISGVTQSQLFFPIFAVGTISMAIIDTWLYLRSGANLLLALLVHLMTNYCSGILGPPAFPFLVAGEATAALAIVIFGGLKRVPVPVQLN